MHLPDGGVAAMEKTDLPAIPLDKGLRDLGELEALVGRKFVAQTAALYRSRLRTASNEVQQLIVIADLHPLAAQFDEYLSIENSAQAGRPIEASPSLTQLAADVQNLLAFRAEWDDGPSGSRRKYLVRRLKTAAEAMPCLYEFRIGMHFRLQGASVELRSARKLPGCDMHVAADGIVAEVECKHTYPWTGRKIQNPVFTRLVDALSSRLRSPRFPALVLTLICRDKLRNEDTSAICSAAVELAITGKERSPVGEAYTLVAEFLGARPFFADTQSLRRKIQQVYSARPHAHIGVLSGQPRANRTSISLVVVGYSSQPDDPVETFFGVVDSAKHQLSGQRPGIVSVHLPEVYHGPRQFDPRWAIFQTFQKKALQRRLQRVGLIMLTFERDESVEEDVYLAGGPALFLHNAAADYPLPNGFPGSQRK